MNSREMSIRDAINHKASFPKTLEKLSMDRFGCLTFNRSVMEKMLPQTIFENLIQAMEGKGKVKVEYISEIANAMKEWAVNQGATHFCHWFLPLTGIAAEKHDAFIEWKTADTMIEKFSSKQLMRGEPDASSFPSGGLRKTSEARGYTSWDPTSLPFLWKSGGNIVLCIPAVFFSWTGQALDTKIPLLRSDSKISQAAMRLMDLFGIKAKYVYSTLGCEQEYFLVDRSLYYLRPDLLMIGRTVFGAPSPKGQELEDHYFGTVKERVLAFMRELEEQAFELGIPLKTRHNEVAPGQHEVAPVFEKASIAVDHNIILMELMRQIASRHHLTCLLHEKPFAGINGSGKHNNWSLSTDQGLNLLDPSNFQDNSIVFLVMLTSVIHAVYEHAALLRASIASHGNDFRLGGHEAPPVIISIYLGEALEKLLDRIEKNLQVNTFSQETFDLGILAMPELPKDHSDRNRTSPFAFTGSKFEFRAVGSSANCALPITVINAIVAQSLNRILDEIEKNILSKQNPTKKDINHETMQVVKKYLKISRPVRFSGDNYSAEWQKEAKKRGLPIINKSLHAFEVFKETKIEKVFEGILTKEELISRVQIMIDHYSKVMNIEARLMVDMFRTQILPAAFCYQKEVAKSLKLLKENKVVPGSSQLALLKNISKAIDQAIVKIDALEKERENALKQADEKKGKAFCEKVCVQCEAARKAVDQLEMMVDDHLWPFPKYRELLNIL